MKTLERIKDLAEHQIGPQEHEAALRVLQQNRVVLFIVAYDAERHLESLFQRIPASLIPMFSEIVIFDDSSSDATFGVAEKIKQQSTYENVRAYRTPFNRGYGGNQKLGYLYCIRNHTDIVILLHGDGQYPPEFIPRILAPFETGNPDAVFASRMINKKQALAGGMPFYKWIGNQLLTNFENWALSVRLSEFHTGFRAYRVHSLEKIPFVFNSDDFHFDTEIIIQAVANHWKILEVPIPAYYGTERCHVNGIRYAYNCAKAVFQYEMVKLGLLYQRNYDFGLFDTDNYQFKKSKNSLHQFVLNNSLLSREMTTLELGANRGILSAHVASRVKHHVAVDQFKPDLAGDSEAIAANLNEEFSRNFPPANFDCCFALDVIEHLDEPERFLCEAFALLKTGSKIHISTANICYLPMRFSLLLGQFNYGKRGILDRTHKRLFSVSSFRRMIQQYGFRIEKIVGFPPPVSDLISDRWHMRFLERIHGWLSRKLPNLFAYNFLVIATRMDDISDIFDRTVSPP